MAEKKEQKEPNFRKPPTDFSELEKNPYVKKWVENYSKKNQRPRLSILTAFCKFTKKTPSELILEHAKDIRQEDPLNIKGTAKKQLKEFYLFLRHEKNNSLNTAYQHVYSKLVAFWSKNNVPVVILKGEKPSMNDGEKDKVMRDVNLKRIKNKKDKFKNIRDALKSTRDKAILLCKISTGIDDVDLFVLKIEDFNRGLFDELNVCYIQGNRIKPTGNPKYQAILNSEACELIKIYLAERKKANNNNELDLNDYLFVSNKNPSKRIRSTSFADNLRVVTETLEIKHVTPKYFRNWFNTITKKEGIPVEIVERMMGHKRPISETYQQIFNDYEEFVEEYADKINEITGLGNGSKRMVRLEDKQSEFEKIIAEQVLEMDSMKKDLSFLLDAVKKYKEYVEKFPPEVTINYERPSDNTKTCKTCGKEFKPKTHNQVYCKKTCQQKNNK